MSLLTLAATAAIRVHWRLFAVPHLASCAERNASRSLSRRKSPACIIARLPARGHAGNRGFAARQRDDRSAGRSRTVEGHRTGRGTAGVHCRRRKRQRRRHRRVDGDGGRFSDAGVRRGDGRSDRRSNWRRRDWECATSRVSPQRENQQQ